MGAPLFLGELSTVGNIAPPTFEVGERLTLLAQPDNKYDKFAVKVMRGDRQVGWIPKGKNQEISRLLQQCEQLYTSVTAITPYGKAIAIVSDQPHHYQTKEQSMSTSKISNTISKNIDLGTSAAFLEAGRIANKQLSAIAGKKLPIVVRAYADTSVGRLILANIALLAQEHFRPNDERLQKLATAMTVQAYQEILQTFDIEQFIDDLLSNATIKKALRTVGDLPAE